MKKNTNILFVTATKEDSTKSIYWYDIANEYSTIINGICINCTVKAFMNNDRGLSEVYNEALAEYRHKYDYIIFIHNDTLFVSLQSFLHEIITNGKTDIMGLAGATEIEDIKRTPCAWNVVGGKHQAGEVWHRVSNDVPIVRNQYAGVPRAEKAATVDGLCLIFAKGALDDDKLVFDNRFTFDFYDMDLCFTAKKLEHSISIIHAPIIHYSSGAGVLKQRYKDLEKIFREKWNV